jgi:hypothetical protein
LIDQVTALEKSNKKLQEELATLKANSTPTN